MVKIIERYLKCNYYDDTNSPIHLTFFSHECLITFKSVNRKNLQAIINGKDWLSEGEDWLIVHKEDVVPFDEDGYNGLVKLVHLKVNEVDDTAFVGIRNAPDKRIDYYTVPLEETLIR